MNSTQTSVFAAVVSGELISPSLSDTWYPGVVFLRFPNEAVAQTELSKAGLYIDTPYGKKYVSASDAHGMDVIGVIKITKPSSDIDLGEVLEVQELLGFHVNLRLRFPISENLVPYVVEPQSPYRKFLE